LALPSRSKRDVHSHSELGTRSDDSGDTSLEKGSEALFLGDGNQSVDETLVVGDTSSSLGLKSSLDTVCGSGQVGSRHTSDSSGGLQQRNMSITRSDT
jgi:hypothetical protein